MAKPARQAEPPLLGDALAAAHVPVLGRINATAVADGGDFVCLTTALCWAPEATEHGIKAVEVPHVEYLIMACNVLVARPRVVAMVDGSPRTRSALEAAGCEVHVYGGPTCLTAPLWRTQTLHAG
jgi:N-dimethylarginine dimethylaminohydrolase